MERPWVRFWTHQPWIDYVISVLPGALSLIVAASFDLGVTMDTRIAAGGAVAGLAGLGATAQVFACSMMYTSNNPRLTRIMNADDNAKTIARNWVYSLTSALIAAVLAVASLLAMGPYPSVALCALVVSLSLTTTGFSRAVYWLRFTLLQDRVSEKITVLPDPPRDIPMKPLD